MANPPSAQEKPSAAYLRLALLLVAGLLALPARAQTPLGSLPFVTYGEEVGFGQWNVTALAQDDAGLLWVGTDEGLYQYDGQRIHPVPLPEGLPSRFVHHLARGRDGSLWCVLRRGVLRWHHGRWSVLEETRELGAPMSALATDGRGRAHIASSAGLFQEQTDGHFEPVPGYPGRGPRALFFTARDEFYVVDGSTLHRRDSQGRWHSWSQAQGLPSLASLNALHDDGTGRLWLGGQRFLAAYLPHEQRAEDYSAAVSDRWVFGFVTDSSGTTWMSSSRGLFTLEQGRLQELAGLPHASLQTLFLDREGSLWAGGQGLHRLAGRGLWRHYWKSQPAQPLRTAWALARDPQGQLWVATNRGLARATSGGLEEEQAVSSLSLFAVRPMKDGRLWLGGTASEVLRYTPRTGELERWPLGGTSATVVVFDLEVDAQGRLWVGTNEGLFQAEAGAASPRLARVPGTAELGVDDLQVDGQGRLWAATTGGLWVVERGEARRLGTAEGLRSEQLLLVTSRRNGELCVAYRYGLGLSCLRYEAQGARGWSHLDRGQGLSSDTLYVLGEDAAGRLWAGSGRGVDLVVDGRVVESLTTAEGLPGNDCNARAFLAEPGGDVWLGTNTGLGRFLGARYTGPPPPPAVVLTAAHAGAVDLLATPAPLELHAKHGSLEFTLALPGYALPAQLERQVRLVGLEDDFRPAEELHLRYGGLPPGAYELQARARYRHGEFGPMARLAFLVRPPLWQTWWFLLASALALAGLGALLMRARQVTLRRRNAQLERVVAERTEELRQAQARLLPLEKEATEQRMAGGFAHEMRNALAGARLMLARLQGADGAQSAVLTDTASKLKELYLAVRERLPPEERARVATLMRQVSDNQVLVDTAVRGASSQVDRGLAITRLLLEYARLGRETPGQEPVPLAALARAVLAEVQSEPREFQLQAQVEVPETLCLTGREEHLHSILKNLVSNARDALADTAPGHPRRLRIAAWEQAGQVYLEVEDSGPGIAEADRERIFESFFSTKPDKGVGLGLGVVRKLVGLYGGTITVGGEPGQGARFTLTFPRALLVSRAVSSPA